MDCESSLDHMGCHLSLNKDLWLLTYQLESTKLGRKIESVQLVLFFYQVLLSFTIPLTLASA